MNHPPTRSLFLTGATGFVGKVVLAELMRRRDELGIERVYVLIREKRGKTPERRFDDIAASPAFGAIPDGWRELVRPLTGELTRPDCGLSPEDLAEVRAHVTHVVHCAASVDFDLPLNEAAEANITSALNVLTMARECSGLQRMISVSTAYVTPWAPDQGPIPERLVDLPFDPAKVYDDILAGRADAKALMRASGHPNTYTLTKCIAEHLLVARRGEIPLSLVRPSIISASLQHPMPGWIDSAAALAGFLTLAGAGLLKVIAVDPGSQLDVVPCDVVSDRILAELPLGPDVPLRIRYAAAGLDRNLDMKLAFEVTREHFTGQSAERPFDVRWMGAPGWRFALEEWRHQTFPLHAGGVLQRLLGNAKLARTSGRLLEKLRYVNRAFRYFTSHRFDFSAAEPALMPGFEARSYLQLVNEGVSRHLLRRDPSAMMLAGREYREAAASDLLWALKQPKGNWTIRGLGFVLRKIARYCTDRITYDQAAFERAIAQVPPGAQVVLAPTHRSYTDFLICSFLCFARPELGIKLPYIAAAEEFARIPVLGGIFTRAQAFYLRRGLGREDEALTRQVHELVSRGEVVEFFIEGARSRSRQFLSPRTGLLRCLQGTGRQLAILPVAISYDRVPEEALLERELAGEPRPRFTLRGLLHWGARARRGEVSLGRIHLACAEPVLMGPGDDVYAVARDILSALKSQTGVTRFHLRTFLAHARPQGLDEAWLVEALKRRGAPVLDSSLAVDPALTSVSEISLRQQWMPWFYADALRRWPDHPVLRHEALLRQCGSPLGDAEGSDPRLETLLEALFAPLLKDAETLLDRLGTPPWAPRLGTPSEALPDVPGLHLLHAQAVFDALAAEGVLGKNAATRSHVWGPSVHALDEFRQRCRQGAGMALGRESDLVLRA